MVRLLLLAAGLAWLVRRRPVRVARVLRVNRLVVDVSRAVEFYAALGFQTVGRLPDAALLRLGGDHLLLLGGRPGAPPGASDLSFQHLALVVDDIAAACRCVPPAEAISQGGPVTLPAANGSVTAWKFRDPDGYPLELLHFPPGQGRAVWQRAGAGPFLGIDHSALAVSGTKRSVRFYRRLGFRVSARSWNAGADQDRLDGLRPARAHVTSLRPRSAAGPGLELLGYAPPGGRGGRNGQWTTVLVPGLRRPRFVRDPDGHVLQLTATV